MRALLATTAVAAVLVGGLSGHGPHHVMDDGMAGAGAGLCLLLATAVVLSARPARARPEPELLPVDRPSGVATRRGPLVDRRARASPVALQRFRN